MTIMFEYSVALSSRPLSSRPAACARARAAIRPAPSQHMRLARSVLSRPAMSSSPLSIRPAITALLAFTSLTAHAADPLAARYGMTPAQFQAEFNTLTSAGYRPTHISGYTGVEGQFFAAIFEQKPAAGWVARYGLTWSQYQQEFSYWTNQGYRPVVLDGYEIANTDYYTAIFELQPNPPAWVSRHGLTSAQYQAETEHWVSLGYRVKSVQGYGVQNIDRYAAIWELTNGPGWQARHGLNLAQYQAENAYWTSQGYRLAHISGYQISGTNYYAAIWEHAPSIQQITKIGMTPKDFQHQVMDNLYKGYRLKQVDGYPSDGDILYAAIWEAEPDALDGDYCKNNVCFDLKRFADGLQAKLDGKVVKYAFELRRGTAVIQRSAGPKRTSADAPASNFTVFDRFNPASVSKTITAAAVMQLLTEHGIEIDDPVWPYLPPTWNIPPNNRTITFAELMNHGSGLREGTLGLDYPAVKTVMERSILMSDKQPPAYENINSAVLRVLVASLDGFTTWNHHAPTHSANRFIQYVGDHVTEPLGIYSLQYRPDTVAPTMFYPNPPGTTLGTTYGDWTVRAGPAGAHLSVHELALFATALFKAAW